MHQLNQQIKSCTQCPLYKDMPFGPIFGHGSLEPKYIIVTEHPSKDDSLVQEVAYDHLGLLCKKLLREAGIDLSTCYFTTYLKCHSPEGLKKEYISKCKWLELEIEKLRRPLVIGFGKNSLKFNKELVYLQCPSLYFLYVRGKKVWDETVALVRLSVENINGLQT